MRTMVSSGEGNWASWKLAGVSSEWCEAMVGNTSDRGSTRQRVKRQQADEAKQCRQPLSSFTRADEHIRGD